MGDPTLPRFGTDFIATKLTFDKQESADCGESANWKLAIGNRQCFTSKAQGTWRCHVRF